MFKPKLFDILPNYTKEQFTKDLLAGVIVGIVALPLAIAFAIASGVSPEKGLYTAVIAGFIISALGGSRVQIGGPTGAFIVIVYGIVQVHGIDGLIIATFLAGVMLIIMGFARLGTIIKFIPHPLIVGFTTGIALIIFSSQIKDFFGLTMGSVPVDFVDKWKTYALNMSSINIYAFLISVSTLLVVVLWPRVTRKIPGSLVAILLTTAVVYFFHLPVETIGSRFGAIPSAFPSLDMPRIDFDTIKNLIQPAFTIALLCAIESLLSAVVADGMIGGNHKSNMELIAQGTANIFSSIFGGIPATGAIARTATNVKNGGRTPVAGIVHAITLLLIMLFVGKWAALIPMATLAGILVIVAYNMSEWHSFLSVAKGARSDAAVLIITFILTVLIDLTVAIEIGMVLATFLFMHKMIRFTDVSVLSKASDSESDTLSEKTYGEIPKDVEVFEITGPFFFGAAYKFKDAIKLIERAPKIFIIVMGKVPIIDATGIKTIEEVHKELKKKGIKLILAEVRNEKVLQELKKARLLFAIGKANVVGTLERALERSKQILQEGKHENR
jgi:SulP family sulfate permease